MEEQGLAKVPDLELAQLKFEVSHGLISSDTGKKKLLAVIKNDKMAPFYRFVLHFCQKINRFLNHLVDSLYFKSPKIQNHYFRKILFCKIILTLYLKTF